MLLAASAMLVMTSAFAQSYPKRKEIKEDKYIIELRPMEKRGKWGYVDQMEKVRIKASYDAAGEFKPSNGPGSEQFSKLCFAGKWGFLRTNGTYLSFPLFDELDDFSGGCACFSLNGHRGFIDTTGEIVVGGMSDIVPFSEKKDYTWYKMDDSWGVINKSGKALYSPVFDEIPEQITERIFKTTQDGKYGLIDMKTFEEIKVAMFDDITFDKARKCFYLSSSDRKGVIRADGKEIVPTIFENIEMDDYYFYGLKDGKYSIYTKDGKVLANNALTHVPSFAGGVARVYTDRPCLLFDNNRFLSVDMYLKELSRDQYLTDAIVPTCMKDHFYSSYADKYGNDVQSRFSADNTAIIPGSDRKTILSNNAIGADYQKGYTVSYKIGISKNNKPNWADGIYYERDQYGKAYLLFNNETITVGPIFSSLFRTIDGRKITEFDKRHGTSYMTDWSEIEFNIVDIKKTDDVYLLAIVMTLNEQDVQKWYVITDGAGKVIQKWNINGYLHDDDKYFVSENKSAFCGTVGSYFLTCDIMDDNQAETRIYSSSGEKLLASQSFPMIAAKDNDRLVAMMLDYENEDLRILNIRFSDHLVFMKAVPEELLSDGFFDTLYDEDQEDLRPLRISDACNLAVFADEEGLWWFHIPINDKSILVPTFKFNSIEWDGVDINAVTTNAVLDDAPFDWQQFNDEDTTTLDFNQFNVRIYPKSDGVQRYSVSLNGVFHYGYFVNGKLFTQAVFEEASDFISGQATVKIRGSIVTIGKEEIANLNSSK